MVLFLKTTYPLHESWSKNIFFNFDPLVAFVMAVTGAAFKATLLLSVVTVVITLLAGRVFCGWICPLGTIHDIAAKVIPTAKIARPYGSGRFTRVKYWVLAFLVAGSLFGFSALLFFDPLVFLFRVMTLNIFPFGVLLANGLLDVVRPLAMKLGYFQLSMLSYPQPVFHLAFTSFLMFAAVIALVAVERRFWCRNLCPLGALLSLLSRYAPWGRRVAETCIDCSRCARGCPMNAISDTFRETSWRECIQCLRCEDTCPVEAITFGRENGEGRFEVNPSRRSAIVAGAGGICAAMLAGSAAGNAVVPQNRLRPPGTLTEKDFLDMCLRCGECMKVCPTHALQPAFLQAGVEGLFTPVLTPRVGACEERCNLCGQVCPTGAVRALPLEEKQYAVIGNAVIDRRRCIAWEQGKVCLVCDEVCPYDAIVSRVVADEAGTIRRPFILENKCVGCGQCEHACPVNGPAAVRVFPINEVRKNEGSYITEEAKRLREVRDEDSHLYDDGSGVDGGTGQSMQLEGQTGDNLPPGFVSDEGSGAPPGFVPDPADNLPPGFVPDE